MNGRVQAHGVRTATGGEPSDFQQWERGLSNFYESMMCFSPRISFPSPTQGVLKLVLRIPREFSRESGTHASGNDVDFFVSGK